MKRFYFLALSLFAVTNAFCQTLSLDSCRAMALRNNKHLSISRAQEQVAMNVRKAARTQYLPHVDLAGAYIFTSREVSLLNDTQKNKLAHIGDAAVDQLGGVAKRVNALHDAGIITDAEFASFSKFSAIANQGLANYGNALGEKINDAFRTDTRNIFVATAMLRQPIYMGGAITAANNMADIAERMSGVKTELAEDEVLYSIDQAYWMVVSLNQKKRLADSYLELVTKLSGDVKKMIKEGVATRADGLKVDVRVNEAEMTKTQVESGLSLSRMLLCQLCGLPSDSDITLADEKSDDIAQGTTTMAYNMGASIDQRPEVRLLNDGVELSRQATKLARAAYMPQVALVGGYMISNPNVLNGFEKKFGGLWNVGVMVRMPVLDWGDATYKVRATKIATSIANLTLDETKEKIELQITQNDYKLGVANKKLAAANLHIQQAEENLRCANLGFKEGVMSTTEVMAAQTAWFQAQSQKIDAQIDVKLSEAGLKKALGMR